VLDLEAALNEPDIRVEAGEILRGLIEKIVLVPGASAEDGLQAALHGAVAGILRFGDDIQSCPERPASGRRITAKPAETAVPGTQLSVVAGIGFEPMTFRL
jgi:site-specific DNA recombinase